MPPKSFLIVLLCVQVVLCYNFQDGLMMQQQQHQQHHNHRHHRILDNNHHQHPSFRHEHHRHHVLMDGLFPPPSLPLLGSTSSPLSASSTPPRQMHHLRHHNKQKQTWEKRVFPALRTLQTISISTSTIDPLTMTTTAQTTTPPSPSTTITTASPIKMPIPSNHSRRFFDPDEFNSKSSTSLRRVKDLNKTTYKFDPYALPLSDKPHFEFPVKKDVVKSFSKSAKMKKAAWDVDVDDGDVDGDTDDEEDEEVGVLEKNNEEDAIAMVAGASTGDDDNDESLPDRGDNNDLRDRHKMLNDEIYGFGTGSDNNRRGSRSSKYLQVSLSTYISRVFRSHVYYIESMK